MRAVPMPSAKPGVHTIDYGPAGGGLPAWRSPNARTVWWVTKRSSRAADRSSAQPAIADALEEEFWQVFPVGPRSAREDPPRIAVPRVVLRPGAIAPRVSTAARLAVIEHVVVEVPDWHAQAMAPLWMQHSAPAMQSGRGRQRSTLAAGGPRAAAPVSAHARGGVVDATGVQTSRCRRCQPPRRCPCRGSTPCRLPRATPVSRLGRRGCRLRRSLNEAYRRCRFVARAPAIATAGAPKRAAPPSPDLPLRSDCGIHWTFRIAQIDDRDELVGALGTHRRSRALSAACSHAKTS